MRALCSNNKLDSSLDTNTFQEHQLGLQINAKTDANKCDVPAAAPCLRFSSFLTDAFSFSLCVFWHFCETRLGPSRPNTTDQKHQQQRTKTNTQTKNHQKYPNTKSAKRGLQKTQKRSKTCVADLQCVVVRKSCSISVVFSNLVTLEATWLRG